MPDHTKRELIEWVCAIVIFAILVGGLIHAQREYNLSIPQIEMEGHR